MLRTGNEMSIVADCYAAVDYAAKTYGGLDILVSHRFPHYNHNYTAIFLTVCTGTGLILEPMQPVGSPVFGFAIFGLLPWGICKLMAKKKTENETTA